jgi:hypothetical protein
VSCLDLRLLQLLCQPARRTGNISRNAAKRLMWNAAHDAGIKSRTDGGGMGVATVTPEQPQI